MDASAIVIAICKVLCHAPADEHFLDEDPRFSSVPSSFFFRVCLCWVGTAAWVTVVEPAVGKRPAILYQNDDNESVVVSLVATASKLYSLSTLLLASGRQPRRRSRALRTAALRDTQFQNKPADSAYWSARPTVTQYAVLLLFVDRWATSTLFPAHTPPLFFFNIFLGGLKGKWGVYCCTCKARAVSGHSEAGVRNAEKDG